MTQNWKSNWNLIGFSLNFNLTLRERCCSYVEVIKMGWVSVKAKGWEEFCVLAKYSAVGFSINLTSHDSWSWVGLSMGRSELGLCPTQNQPNNFWWQGGWPTADRYKPWVNSISFQVDDVSFGQNRWSSSGGEILPRTGRILMDLVENWPDLIKLWSDLDRSCRDLARSQRILSRS